MSPLKFTLIFVSFFNLASSLTSFIAPITKNQSIQLFTISISLKTPRQSADLLLDLAAPVTWIDCTADSYTSSSYHYIPCRTKICDSIGSLACSDCLGPSGPGCHNNSCGFWPENPLTGKSSLVQAVVDAVALTTAGGRVAVLPNFVMSCADEGLVSGLPDGVIGLAGLGRGNVSLPAQVSTVYASPNVFALCLPPSSTTAVGTAIFNSVGPYNFSPAIDLSNLLTYTPLLPTGSADYSISLTSIDVNGKPIQLNYTLARTRLCTTTPYTVLQSSIYSAFTASFVIESAALNLTVTDPVPPFDVCYPASDVMNKPVGPAFPIVDFVTHQQDVFWRMFGANSMVRIVEEDVDLWCLAFVDGGEDPKSAVVIGSHQMEDNLLQFDLMEQKLGFTSSILVYNTSCADFDWSSYQS